MATFTSLVGRVVMVLVVLGGCQDKALPDVSPAVRTESMADPAKTSPGQAEFAKPNGPSPVVPLPATSPPPAPPPPLVPAPDGAQFSGIEMTVTVDGKTETLLLSEATITARGQGPIATWECTPKLGAVHVVDFAIGDDTARAGQLFVARVSSTALTNTRAGVETGAKIDLRRAGEPGLTTLRGTVVWDADFRGGTAQTTPVSDVTVVIRWKCLARTP